MADQHIRIGDASPRIQYLGDGVQTAFAYPFPIFEAGDLEIYLDDDRVPDGPSIAGAGADAGGTVTFAVPPSAGTRITLRRAIAIQRTSDFQEGAFLRASSLNDELDRLTASLQQVAAEIERALLLDPTDMATEARLPPAAQRAGRYLAFSGEGAPIATAGPVGASDRPVSAFAETLLDDETAAAMRATLGALGLLEADAGDLVAADGAGGLSALPPGAGGQLLTVVGGVPAWAERPRIRVAHFQHQLPSGTLGPSFAANTFAAVPLNAEVADPDGIAVLDADRITLPGAGTYEITAQMTYSGVSDEARLRLRNVTAGSTIAGGLNTRSPASGVDDGNLTVFGLIEASAGTTLEIQVYGTSAHGAALAVSNGEPEIYAEVVIRQL